MITEGENPKDMDRLLVMTFTRAAAAEMRERIQAAIEKKLESEPENEHLQQQAVLVHQFAQITTIDSFCLDIDTGIILAPAGHRSGIPGWR